MRYQSINANHRVFSSKAAGPQPIRYHLTGQGSPEAGSSSRGVPAAQPLAANDFPNETGVNGRIKCSQIVYFTQNKPGSKEYPREENAVKLVDRRISGRQDGSLAVKPGEDRSVVKG
jgi:hypothetical protein